MGVTWVGGGSRPCLVFPPAPPPPGSSALALGGQQEQLTENGQTVKPE